MSRKDFIAIANAWNMDLKHRILTDDERRGAFRIMEATVHQLRQANSLFSVTRFMDAVLKDVTGTVYYSPENGFDTSKPQTLESA